MKVIVEWDEEKERKKAVIMVLFDDIYIIFDPGSTTKMT